MRRRTASPRSRPPASSRICHRVRRPSRSSTARSRLPELRAARIDAVRRSAGTPGARGRAPGAARSSTRRNVDRRATSRSRLRATFPGTRRHGRDAAAVGRCEDGGQVSRPERSPPGLRSSAVRREPTRTGPVPSPTGLSPARAREATPRPPGGEAGAPGPGRGARRGRRPTSCPRTGRSPRPPPSMRSPGLDRELSPQFTDRSCVRAGGNDGPYETARR